METSTLDLNYLDIREFLYKFFNVDLNPLGLISVCFQLALLAWVGYQIYQRFKGTQAERVLNGLLALVPIVLIFYILKLNIITRIFEILSQAILIGLVVIFAPEFRRVLMQLGGRLTSLDLYFPDSKKKINEVIAELAEAIKYFNQHKIGALICLEKARVDRYYINSGFPINADMTKELLETIFSPKSPLHDGAVTIKGSTIVNAGVILPMTENPKLDWQYGTRHRAAIGFTEVTDSLCIIISEETGEISLATQGRLLRCPRVADARSHIEQFYSYLKKPKKKMNINDYLNSFFSKPKEEESPEPVQDKNSPVK